jgi:hypothetical protein
MTTLTPEAFDSLTRMPAREERIIWTLPAIGRRLGRGRDFVAALAAKEGSPIRRHGRQYFVLEEELMDYMKGSGTQKER